MALSGVTKAAKLLLALDPGTAGKLLKSVGPRAVKEIAAELAYIQNTSSAGKVDFAEPVQEFFSLLKKGSGRISGANFVQEMLQSTLGQEESKSAMKHVQDLVQARDPFVDIRAAEVGAIAKALEGESPQVAAMVLGELPPKKSAQLLALLADEMKTEAVLGMSGAAEAPVEARVRVASVILSRLEDFKQAGSDAILPDDDRREQQLRKMALVLRSLDSELRSSMIESVLKQNEQNGKDIQRLMVIWQDLPMVADRPLQEALRTADARQLAMALVDADEAMANKIRQNISERASGMLDEEASLLSSPKTEEIEQAREKILDTLREMNNKGELSFEEES